MTLTADGDDLTHGWRVAVVAVLTADLGLVRQPFGFDVSRRLTMALDAVVVIQSGRCRGSCSYDGEQEHPHKEEHRWP